MLQKALQKGFTIVELLIVVVVVGVLAFLVFNAFSTVQNRSDDSQRQTDITALATQLEVYYRANNTYPAFSQIDSTEKAVVLLPDLNPDNLNAPGQGYSLQGNASTNKNQYGYVTNPANCNGTAENPCTSFVLSFTKVSPSSGETNPILKNSLN
ncbi:MAG TPA: prepilin-type N-terminal cleavage/methylation domain-containing protein [Candidatus Saccharimonadales bacterium]|nr:prepilin-type N-terminal cleavage/methylation domain-containing protein [Candidatus Saccharimonadales bacterium]